MADSADTAVEATQITFKVKASEKLHTITMPDSATVLDLKTKLAGTDFEDVPVERQRLIYSGRVMKNDDALSVYKIKNNNTIHMVKSALSNPTPSAAATSTPTPPAVPQMATGASANNLLAGLTGARFAGHANLPSRDLFGADGGMGAPPSEDEMADLLSNPAIAQTMNEALNNPAFIDHMIQSNPMLARMPNAREMLQSPYFRNIMTNPEAIRLASQMRRAWGGGGAPSFPAPGVTDTTPGAQRSEGGAAGDAGTAQNPFMYNPFGLPPTGVGAAGTSANPLASLFAPNMFGAPPAAAGSTPTGATQPAGTATGTTPGAQPQNTNTPQLPPNPFADLFSASQPQANQGAAGLSPFGLPPISPEALQQMMQFLGGGSPSPTAPADNRPPEERFAEQLRQLNDMGFFDFDRNVAALRRSGGSVQGAIEHLLNGS